MQGIEIALVVDAAKRLARGLFCRAGIQIGEQVAGGEGLVDRFKPRRPLRMPGRHRVFKAASRREQDRHGSFSFGDWDGRCFAPAAASKASRMVLLRA